MKACKILGAFIIAGVIALALSSCSGLRLKKVTGDLPADYMFCPEKVASVNGDFRKCKPATDIYHVVDPE